MELLTANNLASAYFYIALVATILYVIKTFVFSIFGGDAEVHTDFDMAVETDTSFDFLSIQSILAFLMGFGWLGLACLKEWNTGVKLSLVFALIFGFILMFVSAYLMCCIKKLNKNVKKDFSVCVGKSAKAYTKISASGNGQIEIDINGQLSIEKAVNLSAEDIEAFAPVKVVKFEDNKLYIEKE